MAAIVKRETANPDFIGAGCERLKLVPNNYFQAHYIRKCLRSAALKPGTGFPGIRKLVTGTRYLCNL